MSNIVSGVVPNPIPVEAKGQAALNQGTGAKSFRNVLQEGGKVGVQNGSTRPRRTQESGPGEKTDSTSSSNLEMLRMDLSRRLGRLPAGAKSMDDIWPDLLRTRTHMGLLK